MFDHLSESLSKAFRQLKGEAVFSEANLAQPLEKIRDALVDADVALDVVDDFLEDVRGKALGQDIIPGVKPDQALTQCVHDALVEMLGGEVNPKTVRFK